MLDLRITQPADARPATRAQRGPACRGAVADVARPNRYCPELDTRGMRVQDIHVDGFEPLPIRHPNHENGAAGDWCIDKMRATAG